MASRAHPSIRSSSAAPRAPLCILELICSLSATCNLTWRQLWLVAPRYSAEPYLTTFVTSTDKDGYYFFGLAVHEGHPGVYAVVLDVDTITSPVLLAYVPSKLATIEIVQCDEAKLASIPASHCTCAICHEDFAVGEKLRCLPSCEHHFHAGCIGHWLRIKAACPLCNAKVKPKPVKK